MKYYIYISDTKIDMLYPQIPQPLLKRIASSLSIDLKFLGAEVNIGAKGNPSDETRYAKVKIVSEYIEKHLDVGTVDAPSTYFKGVLPMSWTIFKEEGEQELVIFGGTSSRGFIGLGGSPEHIIGSKPNPKPGPSVPSSSIESFYQMFSKLISQEDHNPFQQPTYQSLGSLMLLGPAAYIIKNYLRSPAQQIEFLAKTFLQGGLRQTMAGEFDKRFPHPHVVLGTPIYVAIAD